MQFHDFGPGRAPKMKPSIRRILIVYFCFKTPREDKNSTLSDHLKTPKPFKHRSKIKQNSTPENHENPLVRRPFKSPQLKFHETSVKPSSNQQQLHSWHLEHIKIIKITGFITFFGHRVVATIWPFLATRNPPRDRFLRRRSNVITLLAWTHIRPLETPPAGPTCQYYPPGANFRESSDIWVWVWVWVWVWGGPGSPTS